MPIEFRCTQCNKLLRTGDDTAGRQAKCPECGTVMAIPVPDQQPVPPSQPMGGFQAATSPFGAAPAPAPPDSLNPYQSPAGLGPEPQFFAPPGEIRPTQIDFSETLSHTWAVFTERWLPVLGAFLLMTVISVAASFATQAIIGAVGAAAQDQVVIMTVSFVTQIAYQVFAMWLGIGIQLFTLGVVRGEEARFGLLFAGGPYLLSILLCAILTSLIVLLGLALLIVPGIILGLMLLQAQMLIIDRKMGVIDAMSTSREVMAGNKMTVAGIYLVVGVLGLLATVLTCGLGYFGFLPYLMILNVVVYFSVTGQPTMADRYAMPSEQPGGTPFGQATPPGSSPFGA